MGVRQHISNLVYDAGSACGNFSRFTVFGEGIDGERKVQPEGGRLLRSSLLLPPAGIHALQHPLQNGTCDLLQSKEYSEGIGLCSYH